MRLGSGSLETQLLILSAGKRPGTLSFLPASPRCPPKAHDQPWHGQTPSTLISSDLRETGQPFRLGHASGLGPPLPALGLSLTVFLASGAGLHVFFPLGLLQQVTPYSREKPSCPLLPGRALEPKGGEWELEPAPWGTTACFRRGEGVLAAITLASRSLPLSLLSASTLLGTLANPTAPLPGFPFVRTQPSRPSGLPGLGVPLDSPVEQQVSCAESLPGDLKDRSGLIWA